MKELKITRSRDEFREYCKIEIERRETGRFAVTIIRGRRLFKADHTVVIGRGNDLDEAVKEARDLAAKISHPADGWMSSLLSRAAYDMEIEVEKDLEKAAVSCPEG